MSRPAVFLDRDGTVIREVDYLADPELVELFPGAGEALRELQQAGFALCLVTNQSGVARGRVSLEALEAIHQRLAELLAAEGVTLDDLQSCPHHPEITGPCLCRKPLPGMLLDAAERLDLDLARSWMIGDAERDLRAGERAGCRTLLVETGKGAQELERMTRAGQPPRAFAPGMPEVARRILATTSV